MHREDSEPAAGLGPEEADEEDPPEDKDDDSETGSALQQVEEHEGVRVFRQSGLSAIGFFSSRLYRMLFINELI